MIKINQILHVIGVFSVVIIAISSSLKAMDHKHSAKGQEVSKSHQDQKMAFDRKRTAPRPLAVQPSFAGRLHTLLAVSRQEEDKARAEQQPSNPIRLLSANPASYDVPHIAPLNWAIDDSLKVKVFSDIAQKADKKTDALYRLAHDPIIKKHLHDAKTFYEYNSLKDADGKTMLDHAIVHDDAAFIGPLVGCLTTDERHKAIRVAASQKKLRALLVLVPKIENATDELALLGYFKNIQDLTVAEIEGYQEALLLAQRHRAIRDEYARKVMQKITGNKNSPFSRLPVDLSLDIQEMICVTGDGGKIHPELENTITRYNPQKMNRLLEQGCDLLACNVNGKKDLEWIDSLKRLCFLAKLPNTIPLKGLSNRMRLKEAAKTVIADGSLSKEDTELSQSFIDRMEASFITIDNALIVAMNNNDAGEVLNLLSYWMAADPNCKLDNGYPLLWQAIRGCNNSIIKLLLDFGANPNICYRMPDCYPTPVLMDTLLIDDAEKDNAEKMRLLLEHGANPNVFVRENGGARRVHPLLIWAMFMKRPVHTQLLLKHGADQKMLISNGNPLIVQTFIHEPIYLEMFLKHGADPNITVKLNNDNKKYSLLCMAIRNNKPRHVALLCKYGAHVQPLDKDEDTLTFEAVRQEDSACLEALIAHGIDIDAINKNNNSLLLEAMSANRPNNFRVLLQYGANPNLELPNTSPAQPGDIVFGEAVRHENPEFLKILLAHKGKNAIKKSGFSYHLSLWFASFMGRSDRTMTLLEHKVQQEQQEAQKKKRL